ncbi:chitinase-3-like protein 1 [Pectinophora gossypiella]|uniref:chitinase-3-like protein 1 n=1 Tax=Pectinophora gossypiella TaxID=13191 RepID=UPI00214E7AC6|nr:chitinase-3-like protein 1 [Pectinophora gossypiella]
MCVKIFVLTLLLMCANYVVSSEKIVMCYYGTWATYRWGQGQFNVDNINPFLCSHIVYSFVGINNGGTVVSLDSYLDLPENWGRDNFGKFNALKEINPNLKTLLAVGGWNEGSGKYSAMAASASLRRNFINSALDMVLTHGFDGFDLDWEYPARRDTVNGQADVNNFSQLVKELKEEFEKHGLLVTAAVSSVGEMAALSYDIPVISKYLDIINLMSYDMYGAWDAVTGHNAPLHKGEGDENTPRDSVYSVDVAVEYWLAQGCPPEKLAVGVPFYGRTFTLSDVNVNGVRAPSSGPGIAGPFTVEPGSIGYNEFCNILKSSSWDVRYDNLAKVPYAVQDKNWVSYDDPDSITEKVKYALSKNISGIMMWSIETDDFHGTCTGEDFPLLRAINRALGRSVEIGESISTASPTASTTVEVPSSSAVTSTSTSGSETTSSLPASSTTTSTPITEITSESSSKPSVCQHEGIVADPDDCSGFIYCIRNANGNLEAKIFECPKGLHWDASESLCNYPSLAKCSV